LFGNVDWELGEGAGIGKQPLGGGVERSPTNIMPSMRGPFTIHKNVLKQFLNRKFQLSKGLTGVVPNK